MGRKTPAGYLAAFKRIVSAWERLRPDMSFGGMTLGQFKAAVQPSFDKRAAVEDARYLVDLDRADRDPVAVTESRIEHLKSKVATVREQMQRLRQISDQMAQAPDGQVSLTDPDVP
jgi:hypothetical protein